ncbi:hypothetical protein D3C87_934880 [compost metagenome]
MGYHACLNPASTPNHDLQRFPHRLRALLLQGEVRHSASAATGPGRPWRAGTGGTVRSRGRGAGPGAGQPRVAAVPVPPGTGRKASLEGPPSSPRRQQVHGRVRHPRHPPPQWHRAVGGETGQGRSRPALDLGHRSAGWHADSRYQTLRALRRHHRHRRQQHRQRCAAVDPRAVDRHSAATGSRACPAPCRAFG